MKNIRINEIKKFFTINKSYLLIFLIFTLVFVYGRNFGDRESLFSDKSEQLARLSAGVYDLKNSNELTIERVVNVSPGISYRLFFNLSAMLNQQGSRKSGEKLAVEVLLGNDLGDEKLLQTYNLSSGEKQLAIENIFSSDNYYQYLKIRKIDPDYQWLVTIFDISEFALDVKNQSEISSLKPSIKGITDLNQQIQSNDAGGPDAEFKFSRKNQKIGQVFTADSNLISEIELKMEIIGTGGAGNYQAELHEHDPTNGISADRLAYYKFDAGHLVDRLASGSEKNSYRIPLVAKLVKGKQYVFLLNNLEVKFNPINTLKIYGYKRQHGDQKMLSVISGKQKEKSDSLYFKIFAPNYSETQSERILTGAVVQDLGSGRGFYTYKQHGDLTDFLDIFETSNHTSGQDNVFYDNILKGVSAKDLDGNWLTYKFNTIYLFSKFAISLESPGGDFTDSEVFYSFDNIAWEKIKPKERNTAQSDAADKFEAVVFGDGQKKEIFLRVGYSENSSREKKDLINHIGLFGIKNIKVAADLRML